MMINKIKIIIVMLFITSCSQPYKDLYGDWNADYIYYKDVDLALCNDGKRIVRGNLISISPNIITIQGIDDILVSLTYSIEDSLIKVYESSDARFKGMYNVKITNLNPLAKGSVTYELELESKDIYIYAKRTEFNPFPKSPPPVGSILPSTEK